MLHKIWHEFQLHMKAIQWEVISTCQTLMLNFSENSALEGHNLSCKIQSEKHACTNEHANMAD